MMARLTTVLILVLAGGLSVGLFAVKQKVQDMEDELRRLQTEIETEQKAIRVLRAEWSHLNEPERLETLAAQHLGFSRLTTEQVAGLSALDTIGAPPAGLADVGKAIPRKPEALRKRAPVSRPAAPSVVRAPARPEGGFAAVERAVTALDSRPQEARR